MMYIRFAKKELKPLKKDEIPDGTDYPPTDPYPGSDEIPEPIDPDYL